VIKTRTGYSFRKAVGHIPEVISALKAAGHDYAPIVDRASTFGYAKWVSEAAKHGLPHVFGVELAVSQSISAKKPSSDQWAFLALDNLAGINCLINTATQQFRYQPLLTVEQAVSAPGVFKITGPAPPFDLSCGPIEGVHIPLAPSTPMGVIKRAVSHGWPLIATHDSFYPTPSDRDFYEILCGRGADLQMHAQHILSEEEWRESVEPFGLSPAQIEDALALARRALKRSAGIPLPRASLPHPERKATLREMCLKGAEERGLKVLGDEVYEARLNRELALIEEKDYTDYFYIVSDLCKWAKRNMVVGPARGSSCGSLVCYLLDITDIDPIPYGLIFERFIDVNRDDMPDIDIDFSDKNRHMVFDYLCERYGHDHVARLGTVALYQPKSSLGEVGTALKIPKWMCDAVADSMLERSGGDARALFKIEDTLSTMPAGQRLVQEYPEVAVLTKFEGHPRHNSTHAAGIVVADKPIYEYVAVDERTGSTMCDKKDAEGAFNLLKIDCLGLTQLSIFEDCLELAGKGYRYLLDIPMDDEKAFSVLNEGRWAGIFQFNGIALQSITKQFKVDSFNDIVCVTALARPGPLASGGAHEWVKRRNGSSPVSYPHPIFEPYMSDTLGVVLYQEQVMEIGRNVGDLNWGQVTQLRKAMSKSLGAEYFDQFGDPWKKGAISKGVDPKATVKIWDDLCAYGSWSFNKCFSTRTIVHLAEVGNGFKKEMTVGELYEKYEVNPSPWIKQKKRKPILWSLDESGNAVKQMCKRIICNGERDIYKYTFTDGSFVECTKDHRFIIDGEWGSIGSASIGSLFTQIEKGGVPWIKTHKVLSSVEYIGKEVTYDIEMPTHHNFKLANGLITHNSHSVAYGILSYWCCHLKAKFPLEFAAATLTHESDPDRQLKLLRELVAEGYSYMPVCAETSTEKWSVAHKGGKGYLVGPLSNVKGIGPKTVSTILSARARGEKMSERAKKLLANAQTPIDSLYPIEDAFKRLLPDPHARNIITKPTKIIDIKIEEDDYDVVIFCTLAKINPRDENEAVNIARRGFVRTDGLTASLNLQLKDDTDIIFGKISRFDYERLGKDIVDRGKANKALYAMKGRVKGNRGGEMHFRMVMIKAVKYIGDI
jgi:DNA polymerase III alpha subunit